MRLLTIVTLLSVAGLTACTEQAPPQQASAPAAPPPAAAVEPVKCEDLKSITVANATIALAETVAAGAFQSPAPEFPGFGADYSKLPAFCRVAGSIAPTADSDIRFELWLPVDGWNGRFMQTGNGGAAGAIVYSSLADPLSRGYAVANTDTGHQGAMGDFAWAAGHPEKLTDYNWRAVHELTVTGKALATQHYGKPPERSYWLGCSTGGRQGLKEAQRFPEDYDAIVAGAPASNWSPLMALSIQIQNNIGPAGLGVDKLALLKEAAVKTCDAQDGVTDRVIAGPAMCAFDPASLQCQSGQTGQCLSETELAAARRIYAGVVDGAGQIKIPGTGPASETLWAAYATPQFSIGASYFRNVVVKDPNWDSASFSVDTDLVLAEQADGGEANAMDPDLRAFLARGGKLFTYHGTTDGLIPYGNSVNYFESLIAALGAEAVNGGVRHYLVPGMDHCSGGEGAFAVDWLTAMEEWVEQGKEPEALAATRPDVIPGPPGAPPSTGNGFSRPVCPYPQVARYKDEGSEKEAVNFACAAP